jgi:2-succinyl-6-hydroxy-2,4-cyclohexadiene-1-carboxylate synthase
VAAYTGLSVAVTGAPVAASRPPLVMLHGFTQTGQSWLPFAEPLLARVQPARGPWPVLLPDAPGHGGSAAVRAGLWETAELLSRAAPAQGAVWCGYSMGARMALHVALAYPAQVGGLVLVSGTAGIDDEAARAARRRSDEALARRLEDGGDEGLPAFLAEWLAQPLFAGLPTQGAGLAARLANTAAGLASSLRLAGTGTQEPLWARLGELGERSLPVLLVAGELDSAYCLHAERMAAAIGRTARVSVIPEAGHACHLQRPAEVAGAVASFLLESPWRQEGGSGRQPGRQQQPEQ